MSFVEILIRANVDPSELLSTPECGEALGAWETDGGFRLYWPEDKWSPGALEDLRKVLSRLGTEGPEDVLTIRSIPDRDWNADWAASLRPIVLGRRIRIRQSWHAADAAFEGIELVIDPKRAFGTGYHATTQLVVEWLENRIRGGERVLDVGTGSGILAMVAVRLGASAVLAVDNDPEALECAREYCNANGFGPELELRISSFESLEAGAFDLIVANLDIRTLPLLCHHLRRLAKPGGFACLSGIQQQDFEEVSEVLSESGLRIEERTDWDEWLSLTVRI